MDNSGSIPTIQTNVRRYVVNAPKVAQLTSLLASHLHVADHLISFSFVGKERMRRLNLEYRGKDRSTDVLSFPQMEWAKPRSVRMSPQTKLKAISEESPPPLLGDVVISLVDAEKNAKKIGQGLDREVSFLLIHGMLHLVGHDHIKPQETKKMLAAQKKLLALLEGKSSTAPLWRNCVRLRGRHV